ncbi:GRAM domain-containing protein 2B-like isoform X1 [Colossoma macropomum]|uniref:GRAM domain-containing protein 2B-like isoform X1 n=1 Tax=Colossoma macropomum TaxID=42526 RepID=UPI0018648580|nr:GRAM domain-containing protein 2B-like isoform X1 [Colossoma macropomum]
MKMQRKRSWWKWQSSVDIEDNVASDGALSYSPDSGGLLGKAKGCKMRRSTDGTKGRGLDEAHLELLDISRGLHRSSSTQTTTIEEEGIDRIDGLLSHNSFKNHNKTFQKHFPEISEAEELTRAFTCAIQKEVLYHGRMYVSEQHVCFHSSVLLKETKVVIHASAVQSVKKKNTARVVPNAIKILTNSGEKYLFVSLRNRDACFKLLQLMCPQLQTVSANGSHLTSSPENSHELEVDTISSHSSQEDATDQRRVSIPEHDKSLGGTLSSLSVADIPNGQATSSSTPRSSTSRDGHSTEEEETAAVSWVTMVTEKIKSLLSMSGTTNISKLLIIYLVLVALLLLTSGYIGLRIIALEEQLNTLGAMSEFSLQREYKET